MKVLTPLVDRINSVRSRRFLAKVAELIPRDDLPIVIETARENRVYSAQDLIAKLKQARDSIFNPHDFQDGGIHNSDATRYFDKIRPYDSGIQAVTDYLLPQPSK
ncbi:hypothetical protein ACFL2V_21935 [Pseudomonadota bacterium]